MHGRNENITSMDFILTVPSQIIQTLLKPGLSVLAWNEENKIPL